MAGSGVIPGATTGLYTLNVAVTPPAAAYAQVTGAHIQLGGSIVPYKVGDILTVGGGTGTAATLTVTSVAVNGTVAAASVTTPGNYTVFPTNPVATTDPSGAEGAIFNLTTSGTSVTGAAFVPANPLATPAALPGDVVPVQFAVQNLGTLDPGNFQVQVLLSASDNFTSATVAQTLTRAQLTADTTGRSFSAETTITKVSSPSCCNSSST